MSVLGNWTFSGWLSSRHIDIYELPVNEALNLIYFWATEDGDPQAIEKFDRKLWMPPPGEKVTEGPWSAAAETAAFAAFAAQVNPATAKPPQET